MPSQTPSTQVQSVRPPAGMTSSNRAGIPVLTWPIFEGLGLRAIVTTRAGGVSQGNRASLNLSLAEAVGDDPDAVRTNRQRAAAAIDARLEDLVFAQQVHGSGVAVVTAADRGRGALAAETAIPQVDALIVTEPGPVAVIMAADCVQLVLFDPVRRVLACVHAGWTGTVRGVTTAVVEQLRAQGSDPADLRVGIGPSIHPDRYQVGADVVRAAEETFGPRVDEVISPDGTGAWNFDLWTANQIQLTEAGVPAGQIQLAGLDTGPGTPFFSHRSEAPTGRFAVLARLIPEASQ